MQWLPHFSVCILIIVYTLRLPLAQIVMATSLFSLELIVGDLDAGMPGAILSCNLEDLVDIQLCYKKVNKHVVRTL